MDFNFSHIIAQRYALTFKDWIRAMDVDGYLIIKIFRAVATDND